MAEQVVPDSSHVARPHVTHVKPMATNSLVRPSGECSADHTEKLVLNHDMIVSSIAQVNEV